MMTSRRSQFDSLSFNILTYLEGFEEVHDLEFLSKEGVQNVEFLSWERRNSPLKLPSDLKAFYSLFNGFSLNWKIDICGKKVAMGEMRLNSLDSIQRSSIECHFIYSEPHIVPLDSKSCTFFPLDSYSEYGQILLLYRQFPEIIDPSSRIGNHDDPEIWFLDTAGRCHYICSTFTHFLRIMVIHLGIIGWQMAYTPEGLSETTKAWMKLFCKERLCVDLHWQNNTQGGVGIANKRLK